MSDTRECVLPSKRPLRSEELKARELAAGLGLMLAAFWVRGTHWILFDAATGERVAVYRPLTRRLRVPGSDPISVYGWREAIAYAPNLKSLAT